MTLSLLTWNIHQQGGQRPIPSFVKKEVIGADLAVLTEFCTESEGRHTFLSGLTHEGYRCAASENTGGNDILIAAKTCFPILDCSWVPCRGVDSIPENLRVDLDCGGRVLSVVGIRIKSLDRLQSCDEKNQLRQRQFCWALDWIKDIQNPVLITGDFNNNRRGGPKTRIGAWRSCASCWKTGVFRCTPRRGAVYLRNTPSASFLTTILPRKEQRFPGSLMTGTLQGMILGHTFGAGIFASRGPRGRTIKHCRRSRRPFRITRS